MTDWSDYYCGQQVDSLARCVARRHHDARVGGSVPGLGSIDTVTLGFHLLKGIEKVELCDDDVYFVCIYVHLVGIQLAHYIIVR